MLQKVWGKPRTTSIFYSACVYLIGQIQRACPIYPRIRRYLDNLRLMMNSVLTHPRQPLTGDLKMHFRFGARIFTAASNLTPKWTTRVPTFCTNLGYTTVIVDEISVAMLEGESGKGIHRNLQANGK